MGTHLALAACKSFQWDSHSVKLNVRLATYRGSPSVAATAGGGRKGVTSGNRLVPAREGAGTSGAIIEGS